MNWTVSLALAVLGCVLADARLAPAQSVAEPPRRVAIRGIVAADVVGSPPPTFSLLATSDAGRPPAVATYRLATTTADQPRRLARVADREVAREVVVVGRVAERGGQSFLFVEEILENPSP